MVDKVNPTSSTTMKHHQSHDYEQSSKVLIVEPDNTQWAQIEAASRLHFPTTNFIRVQTPNHALKQLNKWIYGESTGPKLILVNLDAGEREQNWELLTELKADSTYTKIPILVFSAQPADICKAYQSKVNSCIVPPQSIPEWNECFKQLRAYWWDIASLPTYLI